MAAQFVGFAKANPTKTNDGAIPSRVWRDDAHTNMRESAVPAIKGLDFEGMALASDRRSCQFRVRAARIPWTPAAPNSLQRGLRFDPHRPERRVIEARRFRTLESMP